MEATLFIYFSLFLSFYILAKNIVKKLQNHPPAPFPALPLIGHLHLIKKPIHRTLSSLSTRYGPVLLLRLGFLRVLVVTSQSGAEECFTKHDIVFANRPRLLSRKHLSYNYTSIIWAPYGNHWRNLRRIASLEILSSHRVQMLSHIRLDEAKTLVRRLFSVSVGKPGRATEVEMKSAFFEFVFNAMMRMIAGKRYYGDDVANSAEAKKFREIVAGTLRLAAEKDLGDYLPFVKWFGSTSVEKRGVELHHKRDKLMQDLIDQQRDQVGSDESCFGEKKRTLIEILLSLHDAEPEYYTDENIKSLMLSLLQAGTDTSAGTMEWAMSHLLDNPDTLKKAQTEIDTHMGADRLVDESDLTELPYLRCIINETLRMHPPSPLLLPHESSAECTIGGFKIPSGTMLLVNMWAIQNDPKIWKEPSKFMPERFEGFQTSRDGFHFMPFGSGRRGCPGEGLALRMVGLVLATLIQCFDWERVGEAPVDLTEGTGINAAKAQPLMAKCQPRSKMMILLSHLAASHVS